jgi:hemoglobin
MTSAGIARSLPPGLEWYGSSPKFTPDAVPGSLLTAHTTKPSVWGLLRVQSGRLLYCLDVDPPQRLTVEQGGTAVIAPGAPHHVQLLDADTAFLIEFHREAGISCGRVGHGA